MAAKTIKKKIYSAQDIADFFVHLASQKVVGDNDEREGITNLKLQKILYLAQAYYLAKLGRPLFKDEIQAWTYGPVIPTVYNKYKKYQSNPIIDGAIPDSITDEDKINLNKIWDTFGGYSASRLVDITHAHAPWKEAYTTPKRVISNAALREYYTPLLTSSN